MTAQRPDPRPASLPPAREGAVPGGLLEDPLAARLAREEPLTWWNPAATDAAQGLSASRVDPAIVDDAAARLERFRPWIAATFPDTAAAGGLIESPLQEATAWQNAAGVRSGRVLLKRDDILPVSGSVKARGGVHEVLQYAESLAVAHGLLPDPGLTTGWDSTADADLTLDPGPMKNPDSDAGAGLAPVVAPSLPAHRPSSGGAATPGSSAGVAVGAGDGPDEAARTGAARPTDGTASRTVDCTAFSSAPFRALMAEHRVVVGSTGNLGLSIGIISAALGLQATVHMSTHAQQWKKDLLRSRGVEVVEHSTDYTEAVAAGRRAAEHDDAVHFVDDEHSLSLFAGYAVAGARVARQLAEQGIAVDQDHPLYVYLPCGIGGAPGGVAYGLAREFGDAVRCVFVEPTQAPCMLLGLHTGRHDGISVAELGLTTRTVADGLAVGRPSGFVGRAVQGLIAGCVTASDEQMTDQVKALHASEGIVVEPSAASALEAIRRVAGEAAAREGGGPRSSVESRVPEGATHLAWLTGGGMLPADVRARYLG
ncbi:D-serine ammonia-lyase [Kocuria rhizophila]|uniref:D-serine ammonia-lyase n=1 Tax=Kocuria rhizophila TaxID=72000 RepID=UPI00057C7619|nr:D-serine ammonia-lyase [Kocuria rhizophila]KIC70388.1 D-serine dehydratase [Kocuria rhizophila]KUP27216.1 D-serine dehydratase [Kocuria rhizophila]